MTLKEIADFLNGELHGPVDLEITGPARIETAKSGEITFLSNLKYQQYIDSTKASAIIVDAKIDGLKIPHIIVQSAYVGFVMLLREFNPSKNSYLDGISDQAYIDPSVKLGDNVTIGPFVFLSANVRVDSDTIIYPGTVVLNDVAIGKNCILYPNVSIREECVVGNNVILHNGCVLGSDGFGFAPKGSSYEKIPQLGRVVIEDDVEIGANTTIDRATLGDTIIKRGTKLDNMVQIAHNVIVGEDTVIASQTGVAGSTEIGNNVTIAGQVGIVGHIKINDKAVLAAKSGISKDVPENTVMFGIPAQPLMKQKRIDVSLRHLPRIDEACEST